MVNESKGKKDDRSGVGPMQGDQNACLSLVATVQDMMLYENGGNMKQGKCNTCKTRYVWEIEKSGRNCFCPKCGGKLQPTSNQSGLPVLERQPVGMTMAFEIIRERIWKRKSQEALTKAKKEGKVVVLGERRDNAVPNHGRGEGPA